MAIRQGIAILYAARAICSLRLHGECCPHDLLHRYCGCFAEESDLYGRLLGGSISADAQASHSVVKCLEKAAERCHNMTIRKAD